MQIEVETTLDRGETLIQCGSTRELVAVGARPVRGLDRIPDVGQEFRQPSSKERCIPELSVRGSAAFKPFSGKEPTRLEFSQSCGRSDNEAASTQVNLFQHGAGAGPTGERGNV